MHGKRKAQKRIAEFKMPREAILVIFCNKGRLLHLYVGKVGEPGKCIFLAQYSPEKYAQRLYSIDRV